MAVPSMIETQSDSLGPTRGWLGFVRHAGLCVMMLFLAAVAGVYVTIITASLGGHVDEIMRFAIIEGIGMGLGRDPEVMKMPLPERKALIGLANLLTSLASLWIAPRVARHYGSLLDKFVVALSPI